MTDKEKAALGSIVASAALTAAKAVVGVMTGSLAILSESGHSLRMAVMRTALWASKPGWPFSYCISPRRGFLFIS